MMLNCLVIDSEPLALDLLENYVGRTPFLQSVGRAESAKDALRQIETTGRGGREIDILFLDIQMPQLNGGEFSRLLAERGRRHVRVIFTTVSERSVPEGFQIDALDCLPKPITYPEFLRAAAEAHDWFLQTRSTPEDEASWRDSIWVRSDYRQVRIRFDEILYIEGMKDYVRIRLADGGQVMTQLSLKAIGEQLPDGEFVRVHRSYIVRIPAVRTMERGRIVVGKTRIPVSNTYRDTFLRLLVERAFVPGR